MNENQRSLTEKKTKKKAVNAQQITTKGNKIRNIGHQKRKGA